MPVPIQPVIPVPQPGMVGPDAADAPGSDGRQATLDRHIRTTLASQPPHRRGAYSTQEALQIIAQRPPSFLVQVAPRLARHHDERVLAALLDFAAQQAAAHEDGAGLRGHVTSECVIAEALRRAAGDGVAWTALLSHAERLFPHAHQSTVWSWGKLEGRLQKFIDEHDGPDLVERLEAFNSRRVRLAIATTSRHVSVRLFAKVCEDLNDEPPRTLIGGLFSASAPPFSRERDLADSRFLQSSHRSLLLEHVLDVASKMAPGGMFSTLTAMDLAAQLVAEVPMPAALFARFACETVQHVAIEDRERYIAALDSMAVGLENQGIPVSAAEYAAICAVGTPSVVTLPWQISPTVVRQPQRAGIRKWL